MESRITWAVLAQEIRDATCLYFSPLVRAVLLCRKVWQRVVSSMVAWGGSRSHQNRYQDNAINQRAQEVLDEDRSERQTTGTDSTIASSTHKEIISLNDERRLKGEEARRGTAVMANYCPQCGESVSFNDKYCSNCGHQLKSFAYKPLVKVPYIPLVSSTKKKCSRCNGTGEIYVSAADRSAADGLMTVLTLGLWSITGGNEKCPDCNGTGEVSE